MTQEEMTVEQMNRDIAEYMGATYINEIGEAMKYKPNEAPDSQTFEIYPFAWIKYHTSWDWLMPVWQKLRGEKDIMKQAVHDRDVAPDKFTQYVKVHKDIENAILSCYLPTAHSLIHEAIELIKNKEK